MVTFRQWWRENVLYISRMFCSHKMWGIGFHFQPNGAHPFHLWINHGHITTALMSPYRGRVGTSRLPTIGPFHFYKRF